MTIIIQISDATPLLDGSLWYLKPLIVSCLVSGAYLICDLVHCLVGSTRRTSFFQISDATPTIRLLIRVISDLKVNFNFL